MRIHSVLRAGALLVALGLGGCVVYEPAPGYPAPVAYPAYYPAYPAYPAYGTVVVGGGWGGGWHHHWR